MRGLRCYRALFQRVVVGHATERHLPEDFALARRQAVPTLIHTRFAVEDLKPAKRAARAAETDDPYRTSVFLRGVSVL